jgi:hypothetical protein
MEIHKKRTQNTPNKIVLSTAPWYCNLKENGLRAKKSCASSGRGMSRVTCILAIESARVMNQLLQNRVVAELDTQTDDSNRKRT